MKSSFVVLLFLHASALAQVADYPIKKIDSLYKVGNYLTGLKINSEYLTRAENTKACGEIPLALFKSAELSDMLKDRSQAYMYLHRALTKAKACRDDSVEWLATRYLGGFYFGKLTRDSSLYYLKKSYDMIRSKDRPREISSVTGMLGELMNQIFDKPAEAIPYYKISLQNAEASGDYKSLGYAYLRYGSFLAHHGNCDAGVPMVEKSYEIFSKNKDNEGLYWLRYSLSFAYAICNRTKEGYELLRKHIDQLDSVYTIETARQTAYYQTLYETATKEKENIALTLQIETEARQRRNLILFFSITFILLVAIFILIYRQYSLKKKVELEKNLQLERERISRELHDNIGTKLSQVASTLDWVNSSSQPIDDSEKKTLLDSGLITTKDAIHDLREAIWAMKKSDLSFIDFADKLKTNLKHYAKHDRPVSISFQEKLNGTLLSPQEGLDLLRICQEAVSNAFNHSQCSNIEVELESEADRYNITITDDGIGFDLQNQRGEHYGLINMQHRAKAIGATLKIITQPGKGTMVSVIK